MLSKPKILILFALMIGFLLLISSCKKDNLPTDNEVTTEEDQSSDTSPEVNGDDSASANPSESGENTEQSGATKEKKPSETKKTTESPAEEKFIDYLTGLECTKEEQSVRPISVMINNIKPAMPTVGVSYADILYECLVEGGQTRLMMVLHNYADVPVFGSVRSSRDYYIDLAQIHDAIYIHAGGTDAAYDILYERKIDRLDGVNMSFPKTFYRDAERRKTMSLEHTLMATGEGIAIGISDMKYRTTHNSDYKGTFNFYDNFTNITGKAANYICVPFSTSFKPEFRYNETDKKYYRSQFGAPHKDGGNDVQLAFENLIILFVDYKATGHKNGYLDCFFTGDGYGFYITAGKYKTIRWHKDTRQSTVQLKELDNSDLQINPGKSYIALTSTAYNKSVVIKEKE